MTTKKQKIRNNEYYNIQEMFDDLYDKSKNKKLKFKNLMQYVLDERNIELAYRNIKKNKGSKTKGTNSKTIVDISTM
ncbi:MAG: group II intron reverse transcriptase/maturase, partial [Clostridium sp.]